MATSTPQASNSPLLKNLASSDPELRAAAFDSLRAFITRPSPLPLSEQLKLWKYLHYALYMADTPMSQQQLGADIASLVTQLPNSLSGGGRTLADANVYPFLEAFWETISREWPKIDRLRMDKYLLLVRFMLRSSFRYLAKQAFDKEILDMHLNLLAKWPLNVADDGARVPRGLTYHVLDIWVDEIQSLDEDEQAKLPIDVFLSRIEILAQDSRSKPVRQRAKTALEDTRWTEFGSANPESRPVKRLVDEDEDEDEHDEWDGFGT